MTPRRIAAGRPDPRRGFTFLEVALAMVVLLVGMAGIVGFTNAILRGFYQGQLCLQADPQVAERLAQDQVETVRSWSGSGGDPPVVLPLDLGPGQAFGVGVTYAGSGPVASTAGYGNPAVSWPGFDVQVFYNGSLSFGASNFAGSTLTGTRYGHCGVLLGSHFYVFGGYDGGGTINTTDVANIAGNAPGAFANDAAHNLSSVRYLSTCQVTGNKVTLIGGGDPTPKDWPV